MRISKANTNSKCQSNFNGNKYETRVYRCAHWCEFIYLFNARK